MLDDNATSGGARHLADSEGAPPDIEGEISGTALSVPETDPEQIAFNLWNEGRVDEAIAFLEHEIETRSERYQTAGGRAPADRQIEPVSDWRDRHRSALSPADFNAFGSIRTLDLVAKPTDAILPHPRGRSLRPAWIMGVCLAAVCVSAGVALWRSGANVPAEIALPAPQPATTADVTPATIIPSSEAEPEAETAAAESRSFESPQPAAQGAAPPEEPADLAEAPSEDTLPSESGTEVVDVPPPDDESVPEDGPLPEDVADTADMAPETTASIGPASSESEVAPVVEARLPRLRPDPPADATRAVQAGKPNPEVVYASEEETRATSLQDRSPRIIYPSPYDDPMNLPETLTPAEYQALLERRAWAENYAARRRAIAERRVLREDEVPIIGEPVPFRRFRR